MIQTFGGAGKQPYDPEQSGYGSKTVSPGYPPNASGFDSHSSLGQDELLQLGICTQHSDVTGTRPRPASTADSILNGR